MLQDGKIVLGFGINGPACLIPKMAMKHGLISGAPETGKTTCMKLLAEGFSDLGIPVLATDSKGDLSGLITPGAPCDSLNKRWMMCGVNPEEVEYKSFPTVFWDAFALTGHSVRLDLGNVDAMVMARFLSMKETQIPVLKTIYQICAEKGLEFDDLNDLAAVLLKIESEIGSTTSRHVQLAVEDVGEIRNLVSSLSWRGGFSFFGRPELNICDWIRINEEGRGYINIFNTKQLYLNHFLYSAYLVWVLMELNRVLPDRPEVEKPIFVLLLDEADQLFEDCSEEMMNCIEHLIEGMAKKGVAVFLQTEKMQAVPDSIKAKLHNKILLSMNAYTPYEQEQIPAIISTLKPNPNFDLGTEIMIMKKGEGLLSLVDEAGVDGITEKTILLPTQSSFGAADANMIAEAISSSDMKGRYDQVIDYYSAKEMLQKAPHFSIMDF